MGEMRMVRAPWRLRLHGKRPCKWLPSKMATLRLVWRTHTLLLTWQRGRGYHVSAWWKSFQGDATLATASRVWECPVVKKRSAKSAAENVKHLAAMETKVFDGLLSLVEHCAVRQYDDGDPRETGWIQIRTSGAAWSVTVKDPDSCSSFQTVGDTLDKALETAALLLSCDEAPWEMDKWLVDAKARQNRKK